MLKLSPPKSVPFTLMLFWGFSSAPRAWYAIQEQLWLKNSYSFLLTQGFGFLRDGLLILPLLILFWFLSPAWYRLKLQTQRRLQMTLAAVGALCLMFMMANVEFFRYFGSNITITHFGFITDSEMMAPSLATALPWKKFLAVMILFPLGYFLLATLVPMRWLDRQFNSRKTLIVLFILLIGCIVGTKLNKEEDALKNNLEDNLLISFVRYMIQGDDVKAKSTLSIEKILDTLPLDRTTPKSPPWFYFDPHLPLAKAPAYRLCQMGKWDEKECALDRDGDGAPLKSDCNDWEPGIHPGARDIPGNSVDEDCSGIDADPPNIILIHWEGARAVNVGSIGYADPCTPNFDRLAKKGVLFRNAYANGTQTRWSLTSVYNSILPRLSTKWVFKHNPELELQAFPQILKKVGYQTLYFHGGDIGFGGLKPRFTQWFDTMIDRYSPEFKNFRRVGWGITDEDLFNFTVDYLKKRQDKRPYYLTIATLSLHHPFTPPEERVKKMASGPDAHVKRLLMYSDEQLGKFADRVLADPQFNNTVIIVMADHGMNAYAPHNTGAQSTLWEDLVWVPVLLLGKKWNVSPSVNDEIRQLADVGPTILDRLDLQIPNHFIGQSLLRSFGNREPKALFGNANGGISAGLRIGPYKYFVSLKKKTQSLYDLSVDREEKTNLAEKPEMAELCERFYRMVTEAEAQNTQLILNNRIWDAKYDLKN